MGCGYGSEHQDPRRPQRLGYVRGVFRGTTLPLGCCDVCWLLVVGCGCCCFFVCDGSGCGVQDGKTIASGSLDKSIRCVLVVGLLCRQSRQGERSEGVWKKEEGMRCRSARCVWVRWATQGMARSRAWHRRGEWALLLAAVCMYVYVCVCCQGWWC